MKPHEIKSALIELRQSESEHSVLAKHALKYIEFLAKQHSEMRVLCKFMQNVANTTYHKGHDTND